MELKERDELISKMANDIRNINKYLNGLSTYFQRQENGNIITDIKVQAIIEALISQGIVSREVLDSIYKRIIKETQEQLEKIQKEREEKGQEQDNNQDE